MKRILVLGLVFLLTGCSTVIYEKQDSTETTSYDYSFSAEDLAVPNLSNATYITQSENSGNINIDEPGSYVLSGNINGSVIVDLQKNEEATLILDNVNIKSSFAPIYVKEADKVIISLLDGTENYLSDTSSSYEQIDDNTVDAVIFSKADLVFNGTGILNVEANYSHAIVSKDSLTIIDGSYKINAVEQGICGKDSLKIKDGTFTISANVGLKSTNEEDENTGWIYIENGSFNITSTKDSIHAVDNIIIKDGNFVINSGDDGIHSEKYLIVDNGNIDIQKSYEGLEGQYIELNGGEINIVSSDDGINAVDYSNKTDSEEEFENGVQMNNDGMPNQDFNPTQINNEILNEINPENLENFDNSAIPTKPTNIENQDQLQNEKMEPPTNSDQTNNKQKNTPAMEKPTDNNSEENIGNEKNMFENNSESGKTNGRDFMQMDIKASGASGLFGNATDCYIKFNGANITIDAGGDGVDSNGDVEINSGIIIIETSSTGGDAAFDYETGAIINGGEFIAIGPAEMAESFDDESEQYSSLVRTGNYDAGSTIEIKNEDDEIIFSIQAKYQFNSILISSSKIKNSDDLIINIS